MLTESKLNADSASLRKIIEAGDYYIGTANACLLYTSPSPRDRTRSRMPSSA